MAEARLADANAKSIELDAKADESMALADLIVPASPQYYYSAAVDTQPLPNAACDDLGPTCGGRNSLRCVVLWAVRRRVTYNYCDGSETTFTWGTRMSGGYTVTGKPYVTYIAYCGAIASHLFYASPSCDGVGDCDPPNFPAKRSVDHEIELYQYFPATTGGGEICC